MSQDSILCCGMQHLHCAHTWEICVVLPEPVSPITTVTGFALTASRMRSAWTLMGSRTGTAPILVLVCKKGPLTELSVGNCSVTTICWIT